MERLVKTYELLKDRGGGEGIFEKGSMYY